MTLFSWRSWVNLAFRPRRPPTRGSSYSICAGSSPCSTTLTVVQYCCPSRLFFHTATKQNSIPGMMHIMPVRGLTIIRMLRDGAVLLEIMDLGSTSLLGHADLQPGDFLGAVSSPYSTITIQYRYPAPTVVPPSTEGMESPPPRLQRQRATYDIRYRTTPLSPCRQRRLRRLVSRRSPLRPYRQYPALRDLRASKPSNEPASPSLGGASLSFDAITSLLTVPPC